MENLHRTLNDLFQWPFSHTQMYMCVPVYTYKYIYKIITENVLITNVTNYHGFLTTGREFKSHLLLLWEEYFTFWKIINYSLYLSSPVAGLSILYDYSCVLDSTLGNFSIWIKFTLLATVIYVKTTLQNAS